MPRRLHYPQHFMTGDQGILNYVLNQTAALEGLPLERRAIMRWPGYSMDIDVRAVAGSAASARVVHWACMNATGYHLLNDPGAAFRR